MMKYLIKKILTESTDLSNMGEVLTRFHDPDEEEVNQYLKLFNYDMANVYHYLDSKGYGDDFIENLKENVHKGLMFLIEALQIQPPKMSREDKQLFHEHILEQWLNSHPNDFDYETQETGKIIYKIDKGDEVSLFTNRDDIQYYAEHVFSENPDAMDFLEYTPDISTEDIITATNRENFYRMVLWFLKKYEGKVIQNWREEFEHWVEEDGIGDNSFYVTKDRMESFIGMDLESGKYNWLVFITHLDGEVEKEVDEMIDEMKWTWRDNWGAALEDEYHETYKYEFEKHIGKLHGETKHERFYDATELLEDVLYHATKDGIEPGNESIHELIIDYHGQISPPTPENPSMYKVYEYYNDMVKYLFK